MIGYDNSIVHDILVLDDLRKLLNKSDVDKFAHFYNNSEFGADCVFTRTAYARIQEADIIKTVLLYIKELNEQQ